MKTNIYLSYEMDQLFEQIQFVLMIECFYCQNNCQSLTKGLLVAGYLPNSKRLHFYFQCVECEKVTFGYWKVLDYILQTTPISVLPLVIKNLNQVVTNPDNRHFNQDPIIEYLSQENNRIGS